MDQRLQLVADYQRGVAPMIELRAWYGISRKTGYKLKALTAAILRRLSRSMSSGGSLSESTTSPPPRSAGSRAATA